MSKILGVPIRNEIADSIASFMTGVQSGRYDFVFGVVADRPERQKAVDMVDWTKQSTAFLVAAGNPTGIKGIADTCGLRVAVQKASFAEPVLEKQSKICVEEGKPAVNIQILADQATMALAIRSGRIDASFASNAALVYFQSQASGGFEVTGAGDNLMGDLWQASVTPKGSDLTQVILEAWKTMFENGSYKQIMTKWGLKAEMVDAPGINMAK
jgi:polar amino acid transport system substrate-binding protein